MIPDSPGTLQTSRSAYWILLVLILVAGAFVRLFPSAGYKGVGFDEAIYTKYVSILEKRSLFDYPAFCEAYVEMQKKEDAAVLPPTRFLYVYLSHLWRSVIGGESYRALVQVSAFFSILALLVTAGFAFRLGGPWLSLATTALMSMAMNQVHQAQHAMIDGFFTFWCLLALWSLWENLQKPGRRMWLVIYGVSLAAMVTTKENSFFVVVAICGILAANQWLRFGVGTRTLYLTTFAAPLAGFVFLIFLAGGLDVFLEMYRLLVEKSKVLPYAVLNGDGPWYRYFVDLMIISPIVMFLAIGRSFQVQREEKGLLFLLVFFGLTFVVMANVKYGMNIRYATIWDMPLRFLAASQLMLLANRAGVRASFVMAGLTIAFAAFELYQYYVFCVRYPSYALIGDDLLRAVRIVK